jgi:type I restriction enzyme S subunit
MALRVPGVRERIDSRLNTTVQATLNLSDVAELPIILPPHRERQAITHILGTLDDKIELNRSMNETIEAMARALFKSWFIDFDPVRAKVDGRKPQGMDEATARLLPDHFQESTLGDIPSGWSVGTIGDIATNPRRGVQPHELDSSTPYIGLEHMPRRSIALAEWGVADELESNKFAFREGEVLFGKLRPYFHKVGIATISGVCSTDILVVTAKEPAWFGLMLGHVSSADFVNHTDAGSTGTKMPRTNWNNMSWYAIVLPPEEVARQYTRLIEPIVLRIASNIHEGRSLAAIRDSLLPKLLSGELSVNDAERFIGT